VSFTKKVVTAYAKSLFQNVNSSTKTQGSFEVTNVTSITSKEQEKAFVPDVFIIGEELLLLRSTLNTSKKLNEFFKNPTYVENQKLEVLLTIFPGLSLTTKSFLKVLTERSHLSLIPEVSDEYNSLLLKFKNSTIVKLVTASALEESYGTTLLNSLKTLTNSKEIILNVSYNPKLLGGLILEYKSAAIDASILKEFSLFFTEV
jgi:F-type H+-transporting ATPase subunit delta